MNTNDLPEKKWHNLYSNILFYYVLSSLFYLTKPTGRNGIVFTLTLQGDE